MKKSGNKKQTVPLNANTKLGIISLVTGSGFFTGMIFNDVGSHDQNIIIWDVSSQIHNDLDVKIKVRHPIDPNLTTRWIKSRKSKHIQETSIL